MNIILKQGGGMHSSVRQYLDFGWKWLFCEFLIVIYWRRERWGVATYMTRSPKKIIMNHCISPKNLWPAELQVENLSFWCFAFARIRQYYIPKTPYYVYLISNFYLCAGWLNQIKLIETCQSLVELSIGIQCDFIWTFWMKPNYWKLNVIFR